MITVKELMTSPVQSSPDGRHWEPGIPKKAAPWWVTLRDAWAVLKGQAVAVRQTTKEDLKDKKMIFKDNTAKPHTITFNKDDKQNGILDFSGPEMTFSGDMAESTKVFFDCLKTAFKDRLEQERMAERELLNARIKELEHQAARYEELRTWDFSGHDYGLYSPQAIDEAVDEILKDKTNEQENN
jgi:hypothetical protein